MQPREWSPRGFVRSGVFDHAGIHVQAELMQEDMGDKHLYDVQITGGSKSIDLMTLIAYEETSAGRGPLVAIWNALFDLDILLDLKNDYQLHRYLREKYGEMGSLFVVLGPKFKHIQDFKRLQKKIHAASYEAWVLLEGGRT